MENYQELYNKILDELAKLEENNNVLKQELDIARKEYDDIKQDVIGAEKMYTSLIQERDSLVKSKKENTHFILLFLLSIVFILCFILNLFILTPIIMWINTLIKMTDFGIAALSIGGYLGSIALSTFMNVKIFKKVNNFFVDRTYIKTINSEEYKDIVKRINETMKRRQSLFFEELGKKASFDEIEMKSSILDKKISQREAVLEYIQYELNDCNDDNKVKSIPNDEKVRRRKKQEVQQ